MLMKCLCCKITYNPEFMPSGATEVFCSNRCRAAYYSNAGKNATVVICAPKGWDYV
jgi:hypothetical protein